MDSEKINFSSTSISPVSGQETLKKEKISSSPWINKIKDYFERKPDVSADLPNSSSFNSALGGGLGGFFVGGIPGALGGILGGYCGVKLGEKTGSLNKAIISGAIIGGAVTLASALITAPTLASQLTNPIAIMLLSKETLIGALSGISGTLAGSRLTHIRDGASGGFTLGLIAKAFSGQSNLFYPLISSISGALGSRASTDKGRAVNGAIVGGILGVATSIFGNPLTIGINTAMGACLGALGSVFSPKIQQGIRNLTEDIQNKIQQNSDSIMDKFMHRLGKKNGLITIGVLSGSIGLASIGITTGFLFGPIGAIIPAALGGILGGIKFSKLYKDIENIKLIEENLNKIGPSLEDMHNFICNKVFKQIEENIDPKEKEHFLENFSKNTLEELKRVKPQIEEIKKNLSVLFYNEIKEELKKSKNLAKKNKFINDKINLDKPFLTEIIISQLAALINQSK